MSRLLGSICSTLVHHAHRPVLLVPSQEPTATSAAVDESPTVSHSDVEPMLPRPRCRHCADMISAYEPIVLETPHGRLQTSLAAESGLYGSEHRAFTVPATRRTTNGPLSARDQDDRSVSSYGSRRVVTLPADNELRLPILRLS